MKAKGQWLEQEINIYVIVFVEHMKDLFVH